MAAADIRVRLMVVVLSSLSAGMHEAARRTVSDARRAHQGPGVQSRPRPPRALEAEVTALFLSGRSRLVPPVSAPTPI
jgi:hypothetical protein